MKLAMKSKTKQQFVDKSSFYVVPLLTAFMYYYRTWSYIIYISWTSGYILPRPLLFAGLFSLAYYSSLELFIAVYYVQFCHGFVKHVSIATSLRPLVLHSSVTFTLNGAGDATIVCHVQQVKMTTRSHLLCCQNGMQLCRSQLLLRRERQMQDICMTATDC